MDLSQKPSASHHFFKTFAESDWHGFACGEQALEQERTESPDEVMRVLKKFMTSGIDNLDKIILS